MTMCKVVCVKFVKRFFFFIQVPTKLQAPDAFPTKTIFLSRQYLLTKVHSWDSLS